ADALGWFFHQPLHQAYQKQAELHAHASRDPVHRRILIALPGDGSPAAGIPGVFHAFAEFGAHHSSLRQDEILDELDPHLSRSKFAAARPSVCPISAPAHVPSGPIGEPRTAPAIPPPIWPRIGTAMAMRTPGRSAEMNWLNAGTV